MIYVLSEVKFRVVFRGTSPDTPNICPDLGYFTTRKAAEERASTLQREAFARWRKEQEQNFVELEKTMMAVHGEDSVVDAFLKKLHGAGPPVASWEDWRTTSAYREYLVTEIARRD